MSGGRSELARWSCLVFGVLFALLFLVGLITCRVSGFPFSDVAGPGSERPAAGEIGVGGFSGHVRTGENPLAFQSDMVSGGRPGEPVD